MDLTEDIARNSSALAQYSPGPNAVKAKKRLEILVTLGYMAFSMLLFPLTQPGPRRFRRVLIPLVITVITFLVFYVNAKDPKELNAFDRVILTVSSPVQRVATGLYRLSGRILRDYLALVNVSKENAQLKEKVQLLEDRLHRLKEVDLENQRLRKLLDFSQEQELPFRTARVVGYDPTSHFRTLRINRGSQGGIQRGMAVATAQGVVGRILRTWPRYADVLLVTDPQSGVDTLVQRTRARGTVEGMGSAAMRLKYLLRLDEVQQGDLIITSGFDGVFPGGLLVGTVSGLRRRSSGVFQEVQVVPSVDLSRVENVVILENPPGPTGELVGPLPPVEVQR